MDQESQHLPTPDLVMYTTVYTYDLKGLALAHQRMDDDGAPPNGNPDHRLPCWQYPNLAIRPAVPFAMLVEPVNLKETDDVDA